MRCRPVPGKVTISLVNGYALMEKWSWDNYNEGITLPEAGEAYRKRFGYHQAYSRYPTTIIRRDRTFANVVN